MTIPQAFDDLTSDAGAQCRPSHHHPSASTRATFDFRCKRFNKVQREASRRDIPTLVIAPSMGMRPTALMTRCCDDPISVCWDATHLRQRVILSLETPHPKRLRHGFHRSHLSVFQAKDRILHSHPPWNENLILVTGRTFASACTTASGMLRSFSSMPRSNLPHFPHQTLCQHSHHLGRSTSSGRVLLLPRSATRSRSLALLVLLAETGESLVARMARIQRESPASTS